MATTDAAVGTETAGGDAGAPIARPERDDRAAVVASRWMAIGVTVAYVGVASALGVKFGLALALLVLAAGALLLVISLIYRSVMVMLDADDDEQGDAAVAGGTAVRTLAEEQKERAVKALRDLEHEHAIGNTNEEDYATLRARFREDAKEAMRDVDEERRERREAAEAWLAAHRGTAGTEPKRGAAKGKAKVDAKSAEKKAASTPAPARAKNACPTCEGANDDDAKFCKHCGKTLVASDAEAG